jgi:Coenzyme PQQ synthesis protein D (PqqD)
MKSALSGSAIVVAAREQVSCDLAGEAAILNLKSGVYYGLDSVGARIWTLIQQPQAIPAIRDVLLTEYDVEAERCQRDLLALLGELLAAGLIEVADEPTH